MIIGSTPLSTTGTAQKVQTNEKDKKVEKQDVNAGPSSKPEGEVYTESAKDTSGDPASKQEKIKEGFEKVGDQSKKITGSLPEEQSNETKSAEGEKPGEPDLPVNDNFSVDFLARTETTAEKETATDRNKQINIVGDTAEAHQKRVELLRSTPQINKTSGPDGENMCGGAALTGAMILDSGKTSPPDVAKNNAAAIRGVYGDLCKDGGKPKKLTDEQDTALKHLADGNMSPKDVENLQKTLYEISQKVSGQGKGGVNDQGMTELVNQLRARCGFAGGSDVKFHCNEGEASRAGGRHWTTTVDGVHVDTWPTNYDPQKPGKDPGKALVTGYPGAPETPGIEKGSKGWVADVSFSGDFGTKMEFIPEGWKKPPMSITFDKNDYKGKTAGDIAQKTNNDIARVLNFEDNMERLKKLENDDKDAFDYEMGYASQKTKDDYNSWKLKIPGNEKWVKNHPYLYKE